MHVVSFPAYPDCYENVLDFPDRNFDDCPVIPRVEEEVVHTPVLQDTLAHESLNVVPEPAIHVPESFLESVPDVAQDLDDVHQSLGSMGVREDADESENDNQVLLSNPLSALSQLRLHSYFGFY